MRGTSFLRLQEALTETQELSAGGSKRQAACRGRSRADEERKGSGSPGPRLSTRVHQGNGSSCCLPDRYLEKPVSPDAQGRDSSRTSAQKHKFYFPKDWPQNSALRKGPLSSKPSLTHTGHVH